MVLDLAPGWGPGLLQYYVLSDRLTFCPRLSARLMCTFLWNKRTFILCSANGLPEEEKSYQPSSDGQGYWNQKEADERLLPTSFISVLLSVVAFLKDCRCQDARKMQ